MEEPTSFNQAFSELKLILEKIEKEDVNIDELDTLLARVQILKEYCDNKLLGAKNQIEINYNK